MQAVYITKCRIVRRKSICTAIALDSGWAQARARRKRLPAPGGCAPRHPLPRNCWSRRHPRHWRKDRLPCFFEARSRTSSARRYALGNNDAERQNVRMQCNGGQASRPRFGFCRGSSSQYACCRYVGVAYLELKLLGVCARDERNLLWCQSPCQLQALLPV